jgi:hypothetical protein
LVDTTELRAKRVSETVPRIRTTDICPLLLSFPLAFSPFHALSPRSSFTVTSTASDRCGQLPIDIRYLLLSRSRSGQIVTFRFRKGRKGNSVRIGDGPAAVTGDECCTYVTDPPDREDATSRKSRKSEDLPELEDLSPRIRDGRGVSVEKSGPPDQFLLVRGLFSSWAGTFSREADYGQFRTEFCAAACTDHKGLGHLPVDTSEVSAIVGSGSGQHRFVPENGGEQGLRRQTVGGGRPVTA